MDRSLLLSGSLALLACSPVHASPMQAEALETVAEAISCVALVFTPLAAIYLFWMVHILPEKIAERRQHPQAPAIKALCLLSLVFGGLLWPLAWLWAYTKPTLFRLAYGRDRLAQHEHELPPHLWSAPEGTAPGTDWVDALDTKALRLLHAQVEQRLAARAQQREQP
jgi:CBS domain containing-hemolysin-like protein